jgi:hypothetical protein
MNAIRSATQSGGYIRNSLLNKKLLEPLAKVNGITKPETIKKAPT